ncbi:MAG: hypothetical protein WCI27_04155 [Candidatus Omnitrophota bacterium]
MRRWVIFLVSAVCLCVPLTASAQSFRANNPDGDKFVFARSFITGLGYYGKLDTRLKAEAKAGNSYVHDVKVIKELVKARTLDNTELRVAKNYLVKYLDSGNMLIRKVAYNAIAAYEQHIIVSSKERRLWQSYQRFRETGLPKDFNMEEFARGMMSLSEERKAAAIAVLEAVVMFKTVLLSAERCADEKCRELALTEVEREKLLKKLDVFSDGNTDWGVRKGQRTFEAAVAAIREILEDTLYASRP